MYDLEEQEKVEALKAWWKSHGNQVLWAVTAAAAVFAAVQGWRYYESKQGYEAAGRFAALQSEVAGNDLKKARALAGELMEQYKRTPYSAEAAIVIAKANYDANDLKSAVAQLKFAVQNAKTSQTRDLARLRLAAVQFDQRNYAEALNLLAEKHDPAFDALYQDVKGDILSAQHKGVPAKEAYRAALVALDAKSSYRNIIQVKLDALGEGQ